jgi:hypothetical protein
MFLELFKQVAIWGALFGIPVFLLTRQDKTTKIFRACGITVKEGKHTKVPLVYSKKDKDYGYEMTLHMPEGLCLTDIQKRQEAIETALNCK